MALLNCIKVRIPTSEGWKDCRMEKGEDDYYYPLAGYDDDLFDKSHVAGTALHDEQQIPSTLYDYYDHPLEVTWQGDTFPQ